MNPTPIEEARRTLQLAANAVLDACRFPRVGRSLSENLHVREVGDRTVAEDVAAGRTLLAVIPRLVRTIENNLHLDRACSDSEGEYQKERRAILAQRLAIVKELQTLRTEAQARFPALAESAMPTQEQLPENLFSLARFDVIVRRLLQEGDDLDEADPSDPDPGAGDSAQILCTVLKEWLPGKGIDASDPALIDFRNRARGMRDDLEWLRRSQSFLEQVHPATRAQWLKKTVIDANPGVGSIRWFLRDQVERYGAYGRFLHDPETVKPNDLAWLETFRQEVWGAVTAVRADFEARLGTRASVAWVLQRYARRCRRLRLEELGTKLGTGPQKRKQREVILTRDAAVFLFDQGFDVVIEQSHGQHRYDILAPSLLVEAKIYSAKRRPLDAVFDGLNQIHQYATALASEGATPEPILVLFRLDGPVADTLHEYTIGNRHVAIVWVDLGPAAESGSHAGAPDLTVTAAAIDRKFEAARKRAAKPKASDIHQEASPMTEDERWEYLLKLDDELLLGGAMFSEWATFITQQADIAFAKGADLASVLTAVAAAETYLRAERGRNSRERLVDLIDGANLSGDLRDDLHQLRRYRNRWVHVEDPQVDDLVLNHPEVIKMEVEEAAILAARVLRRVLYSSQFV